jgi:S1-C subfamily serine protease
MFPTGLAEEIGYRLLGIKVQDLTVSNRRRYKIFNSDGVMISDLRSNSYLASIGAKKGDVIRRINEVPIADREDFMQAVIKYRHKNSVILVLQRGDQAYYITVEI